ncbi:hypothetical protein ACIRO3_05620 [Streptomyces sp. NPDC102278]|uniref:hypothetical protein n=1 Tax=Streptomyces sp. NPDC102278 TaxID=3366152 RepID=UPI00380983EB
MPIDVRPASVFEHVRAPLGPKPPGVGVCRCLSHRIPYKLDTAREPAGCADHAAARP